MSQFRQNATAIPMAIGEASECASRISWDEVAVGSRLAGTS
jgi:hypothetical protein